MKKKHKIKLSILFVFVIIFISIVIYIKTHPLVFNESFLEHAHCMAAVYIGLSFYAGENNGIYPYSSKGYADGLELTSEKYPCPWMLTGPGYTEKIPDKLRKNNIPENMCGRVYIQGLKQDDDGDIAIVFDKLATPGGDHCHLLSRMLSPLGREVQCISGQKKFISENQWKDFSKEQIELLVKAGIPKEKAEWYYNQIDKESNSQQKNPGD